MADVTPSDAVMLSPDGKPGTIPQANVADALKQGFRYGVAMMDPDGNPGVIPNENIKDAIAQGFKAGTVLYGKAGNRGVVPAENVPHALSKGFSTHSPSVMDAGVKPPLPEALAGAPDRSMFDLRQPGELTGTQFTAAPGSNTPEAEAARAEQYHLGAVRKNVILPTEAFVSNRIVEPVRKVRQAGAEFGRDLGRDVVTGANLLTHPEYVNATMPSPYGPVPPPALTPEQDAEQRHPIAMGVAGGVGEAVGGTVADPLTWATLAIPAAKLPAVFEKLIAAGFTEEAARGAINQATFVSEHWKELTPTQKAENLTSTAVQSVFAAMGGIHTLSGGEPNASGEPAAMPEERPSTNGLRLRGTKVPEVAPESAEVPGPGSMNLPANTGLREGGSDVTQLGAAIKRNPSISERLKDADSKAAPTGDAMSDRWNRVKQTGQAIWDAYANPEPWTDFKDARGKWDGAIQRSTLDAVQFAKDVKQGIPSKLKREAIVNYIQAAGDEALLKERGAASKPEYAKGYEAAASLSPEEKLAAQNVSNYFESKLQQAKDSGMLSQGLENYVNQIWDRPIPLAGNFRPTLTSGS